jgi:hypothetical protein
MAPEATTNTTQTKSAAQVRAERKLAAVAEDLARVDDQRAVAAAERDAQIAAGLVASMSLQRIADVGSVHKSNVRRRAEVHAESGKETPVYNEAALKAAGRRTKALDTQRVDLTARRDALIRELAKTHRVVQERLCEIAATSAQTVSAVLNHRGPAR